MPATAPKDPFRHVMDHLRAQQNGKQDVELVDVLSLAEVMVNTMQGFFSTVDTKVYSEFRAIADYINRTKTEIASLQPKNLQLSRIPRAGQELDAIVKQTEQATNTIMENAEKIMAADPNDTAAYQATVQDAVMQIFEACSFQDITGQRISRVVETLKHIEDRVTRIADTFGVAEEEHHAEETDEERRRKELLLNGPQLEGEGVDQSDVDAMFDSSEPDEPASQTDIDALFD